MHYFVAKSLNFDSLQTCQQNNIWACQDRKKPPHPRHILTQALSHGPVMLIFSVNNCHGWHGYANMLTAPHSDVTKQSHETDSDANDQEQKSEDEWYRFTIEWKKLYLFEHGEQCLPFSQTEKFQFTDGQTLNKARNYQELPQEMGQEVCKLIDEHYQSLADKKQHKLDMKIQQRPAAFFQPGSEVNPEIIWSKLMKKVENLGQVILACVFGSQRSEGIV